MERGILPALSAKRETVRWLNQESERLAALCGQDVRAPPGLQNDRFIETTPFFTADHRKLSAEVADLAEREVKCARR